MSLVASHSEPAGLPSGASLVHLPVSRQWVVLRPHTGAEDLLLREASGGETGMAITIAESLARDLEGRAVAWGQLCAPDLDAFILELRRLWIGDRIRGDVQCSASGCGQRIDIEFTITDFLAHHRPGDPPAIRGWTVRPAGDGGWYGLQQDPGPAAVEFRLPTSNDQLAVAGRADAIEELARRCLRPANVPAGLRRRAERVMETMAPSLARELQGTCPACGAAVAVFFDARSFCLRELRDRAAFLYEDVDLIARRYHWSENEILSLPFFRRTAYAELARHAAEP